MNEQANNVNPYDKYGELHNKGLDSIIKQLSKATLETISIEQIIAAVCEYLKLVNGQKSPAEDAFNYTLLAEATNKTSEDIFERLKKAELSEGAIDLIKQLLSIKSNEAQEILSSISEIELKVFKTKLKSRDKNHVLLSLAIAKYSVNYWNKMQSKASSFWSKLSSSLTKFPWKADVEGALGGAIDPITDSIASGTITGPVIIVTKIVGAGVVASAFEYISEAKKKKAEKVATLPPDVFKDLPKGVTTSKRKRRPRV